MTLIYQRSSIAKQKNSEEVHKFARSDRNKPDLRSCREHITTLHRSDSPSTTKVPADGEYFTRPRNSTRCSGVITADVACKIHRSSGVFTPETVHVMRGLFAPEMQAAARCFFRTRCSCRGKSAGRGKKEAIRCKIYDVRSTGEWRVNRGRGWRSKGRVKGS